MRADNLGGRIYGNLPISGRLDVVDKKGIDTPSLEIQSITGLILSYHLGMDETSVGSHAIFASMSTTIENSHPINQASSTGIQTPPLATSTHVRVNGQSIKGPERAGSEAVDANALSEALKDFEDAGHARDRTPGGSPSRKRQRVYGDRYVDGFFW